MKRFIILIAVGALTVAACASDEGSADAGPDELPVAESSNEESSATSEDPIPVEPNEGIGDGASGQDLPVVSPTLTDEVEAAMADLTERLGDDVLIQVVVAHEVTWPDGSLGCPQPDMAYTQVLVDGYRIELSDGTDTYHYHGELGEPPFLCEGGAMKSSNDGGGDATASGSGTGLSGYPQMVVLAAADLAERLGVLIDDVTVVSHEEVDWPDGSLGCPQPDMSYRQVIVNGTLTVFEGRRCRVSVPLGWFPGAVPVRPGTVHQDDHHQARSGFGLGIGRRVGPRRSTRSRNTAAASPGSVRLQGNAHAVGLVFQVVRAHAVHAKGRSRRSAPFALSDSPSERAGLGRHGVTWTKVNPIKPSASLCDTAP